MVDASKLSKLAHISSQLNTETDTLNELILSLEKQLAEMNLGVSAWVCLEEGDPQYDDDLRRRVTYEVQLGYDKRGDGWRIVTRNVTLAAEPDQYGDYKILETELPTPLVNASRVVRIEATELFDDLIDELTQKAEKYLENIQTAKKMLIGETSDQKVSRRTKFPGKDEK